MQRILNEIKKMKKQITINIPMVLLIFGVLYMIYITFKRPDIIVNNQQGIIDSLIQDKYNTIKADSIKYESHVKELNTKINHVQKLRKNEHDKYEEEISKFNRPFDSTMFVRINDSIKKVCCPNDTN